MNSVRYFLLFWTLFLIISVVSGASAAEVKPHYISGSTVAESSEDDADWNSHIDNRAYIEDYQRRRHNQQYSRPPVIVIERDRYTPVRYRHCDSETIYINDGETTVIYRDGYRPNCYPHHIIVPVRPVPYIGKDKGKRMWSTGK